MSYLVFARKWRPQTFDDLIGQDPIIQTLKNCIHSNSIPHAMIFSGIRGVGKTSGARILAKALNCSNKSTENPCNICNNCQEITEYRADDVFEIDAASNTGVDDMRKIIENVKYHTVKSKYKIYIIDEVHMLSNSAFNALLKTLEEPPPEVLFILATTEFHKIPITIKSRCMHFPFRKIPISTICQQLHRIVESNSLDCDNASIQIIAQEADGSLRDAQTILEQIVSFSGPCISKDKTLGLLGVAGNTVIINCLQAVLSKDISTILTIVEELDSKGISLTKYLSHFASFIRDTIVFLADPKSLQAQGWNNDDLQQFNQLKNKTDIHHLNLIFCRVLQTIELLKTNILSRFAVETMLIDLAHLEPVVSMGEVLTELQAKLDRPNNPSATPAAPLKPAPDNRQNPDDNKEPGNTPTPSPAEPNAPSNLKTAITSDIDKNIPLSEASFQTFLQHAKDADPVLGNILEQAVIQVGDNLNITFLSDSFSGEVIQNKDRTAKLHTIFAQLFGTSAQLHIEIHDDKVNDNKSYYQNQEDEKKARTDEKKTELIDHPIVAKLIAKFNATVKSVFIDDAKI